MDNNLEQFERHPFVPFVPSNASVLILGSFPGKDAQKEEHWYYSSPRNQFWKILKSVYPNEQLETKADKMNLFDKAGIAIADIILIAKRSNNDNSDKGLIIIEDNKVAIQKIIDEQKFSKIYFTSKFVMDKFISLFPDYKNGEYIPSPSSIYRRMPIEEKIKVYSAKLPKL